MTPYEAFQAVEMRVGRIVKVEQNEKARVPAYKLWVDLGQEVGVKTSSAQITDLYAQESLEGRLVIAAVNLGERRIAGFNSQVLVMGVPDEEGRVVLLRPSQEVPLGGRVY
ncbi:MAG TPA: tRNA-binding protein [Fimbriimonas sp.]|nr:tRNA-binding protein [Fimbriimonas sp.]